MNKFKVFPYRLHTSGGHVISFYAEFNSPREILEFLMDKELVDNFWTQSTTQNTLVPFIVRTSCIEIIAPVFGRSGITVIKDEFGNLCTNVQAVKDESAQPKVGQVVKKRK